MNWLVNFEPVTEHYVKPEDPSGKIIDYVVFCGGEIIPEIRKKNSIVVFSLLNPLLSLFSDTFHAHVRKKFYDLFASLPEGSVIYDLGYHIVNDQTPTLISKVCKELNNAGNNFIVLSSVTGINTLLYNSIKRHNKTISISEASPILPLNDYAEQSGLREILSDPDNNLFNYSNLGMQSFLNSTSSQDLFRKMLFDTYRMGVLNKDIAASEPVIRDSHIFIFDIESVRVSDAPASGLANPTGFSGFDACRMSRFAGISEKNRTFCINNLPQNDDPLSTTSFLTAQMLWYFTEGWFNRKIEIPSIRNKNFNVFITETEQYGTFTFIQSQISDRWWLQIDTLKGKKITISCLKDDYLETLKGGIPEKFIKFYQKIS
jgi:formiminoglutamase